MSVSSRSSSTSSSSSWSSKAGSRTSSKWSTSTRSRERKLPNTGAVNALVWFSGRNPAKVKGVKVYETLYERDDVDTRSNRSVFWTGTQRRKEYEIVFIESPRIRSDCYDNTASYSRSGWKTSSSTGRSKGGSHGSSWSGRGGGHAHDDDDDDSSDSEDSEAEYGMPVPPPGMHPGGPMPMPPPGMRPMGMGGPMGGMPPPPQGGFGRPMGGMPPPPPGGFGRPMGGMGPGMGGPMPTPPPNEDFIQLS